MIVTLPQLFRSIGNCGAASLSCELSGIAAGAAADVTAAEARGSLS